MATKICFKCKKEKDVSEFYIKKNGKLHSWCNNCRRDSKIRWDIENTNHVLEYKERTREHRLKKDAEYREKNRDELRKVSSIYNELLKEKRKKDRQNPEYKDKRRVYEKQWKEDNKEHVNTHARERYENNINFRIANNLRNRVRKVLFGVTRHYHLTELIGCSLDFLREHLEFQFAEGMNWDNYGLGIMKWNIHHCPPLAYYPNLSDSKQQKEAFHWSHLSPKWTTDNISENSWYNGVRYYYKK